MTVTTLAATLRSAVGDQKICLMRLPLSWSGEMWDFKHPLDFLGYDGGGGIGSGPGMSIGSALALKGTDRLPVAVIGDGDYMMGVNALWTAANARIPMLVVVCNNRSFFNDEIHQERVARQRKRPIENRWIGQRISDPPPDLAMMARGQGLTGIGPVEDAAQLARVLADALVAVKNGATVVVDVVVQTGYSPAMTAGLTRSAD
jgi:thiamine pyrophosphate-dependent acetolactate synthase large subunit-like protein